MVQSQARLKQVLFTSLFYLAIGTSGFFYSFKSDSTPNLVSGNSNGYKTSWTTDIRSWVTDVINTGQGYNFAKADEDIVPAIKYQPGYSVAEIRVSLMSTHDHIYTAVLTQDENTSIQNISVTQITATETTETPALSALALYAPSNALASVTESQAQELLNKAASLPANVVERIKSDPQLISRAANMSIASLINYKLH